MRAKLNGAKKARGRIIDHELKRTLVHTGVVQQVIVLLTLTAIYVHIVRGSCVAKRALLDIATDLELARSKLADLVRLIKHPYFDKIKHLDATLKGALPVDQPQPYRHISLVSEGARPVR